MNIRIMIESVCNLSEVRSVVNAGHHNWPTGLSLQEIKHEDSNTIITFVSTTNKVKEVDTSLIVIEGRLRHQFKADVIRNDSRSSMVQNR